MKINRKLELVKLSIDGISTHEDQDGNVLIATLKSLQAYIDTQIAAVEARVQAEIDEALGQSEED